MMCRMQMGCIGIGRMIRRSKLSYLMVENKEISFFFPFLSSFALLYNIKIQFFDETDFVVLL